MACKQYQDSKCALLSIHLRRSLIMWRKVRGLKGTGALLLGLDPYAQDAWPIMNQRSLFRPYGQDACPIMNQRSLFRSYAQDACLSWTSGLYSTLRPRRVPYHVPTVSIPPLRPRRVPYHEPTVFIPPLKDVASWHGTSLVRIAAQYLRCRLPPAPTKTRLKSQIYRFCNNGIWPTLFFYGLVPRPADAHEQHDGGQSFYSWIFLYIIIATPTRLHSFRWFIVQQLLLLVPIQSKDWKLNKITLCFQ